MYMHMNREDIAHNSTYFTVLGAQAALTLNGNKGPNLRRHHVKSIEF